MVILSRGKVYVCVLIGVSVRMFKVSNTKFVCVDVCKDVVVHCIFN